MSEIDNSNFENNFDDVKSSRCYGLARQIAKKVVNNSTVKAKDVHKSDGPFFCPVCLSEAIVRKCTEKDDHFAHKSRLSPVIKSKNQRLHNECRDLITKFLQVKFPEGKWESERTIKANKEKNLKEIIPDISGRINEKTAVAIEIQLSPYTVNKIFTKLTEYKKRNINVLYIVPLYEELGEKAFRPRLYEKYLHSIYYGRVYYWSNKNPESVIPVHYSPEKREIPMTTWFDSDLKEERTSGGFTLAYKTLKKPNFGKILDISTDFVVNNRTYYNSKDGKKDIPECNILKDRLQQWWDKDEFNKIFKEYKKLDKNLDIISDYEYIDDYDDDLYDNE